MDKKVSEILTEMFKCDDRFVKNQIVLKKLNEDYQSGDPVEIWVEAIEITNEMATFEKGRYDMFLKIGRHWLGAKRYAVKKMVVYILDNPTPNISATDKDEIRRMRKNVESLKKRYYEEEFTDISWGFAAETIPLNAMLVRNMKDIMKQFLKRGENSDSKTIIGIRRFIELAIDLTGEDYIQEMNCCMDLLYKSLCHEKEIKIKVSHNDRITEELCRSSNIQGKAYFWLNAMDSLLKKNYQEGYELFDEDFCVAFYTSLYTNANYRETIPNFLMFMKKAFNVEVTNGLERISKYFEYNSYKYTEWNNTKHKMRKNRRMIAEDLVILVNKMISESSEE